MEKTKAIKLIVSFSLTVAGIVGLITIPEHLEEWKNLLSKIEVAHAQWAIVVLVVTTVAIMFLPWGRLLGKVVDDPTPSAAVRKTIKRCISRAPRSTQKDVVAHWIKETSTVLDEALGLKAKDRFQDVVRHIVVSKDDRKRAVQMGAGTSKHWRRRYQTRMY